MNGCADWPVTDCADIFSRREQPSEGSERDLPPAPRGTPPLSGGICGASATFRALRIRDLGR